MDATITFRYKMIDYLRDMQLADPHSWYAIEYVIKKIYDEMASLRYADAGKIYDLSAQNT